MAKFVIVISCVFSAATVYNEQCEARPAIQLT